MDICVTHKMQENTCLTNNNLRKESEWEITVQSPLDKSNTSDLRSKDCRQTGDPNLDCPKLYQSCRDIHKEIKQIQGQTCKANNFYICRNNMCHISGIFFDKRATENI